MCTKKLNLWGTFVQIKSVSKNDECIYTDSRTNSRLLNVAVNMRLIYDIIQISLDGEF
jgi:hypothetical protein